MATPTIQELISKNIRLIALPEIVSRINSLLNDPNATAHDIATLISQDPALTMQLLKVVNSPLYNLAKPVDSVDYAVNLLGTRQLRDLVIATVLIKRFKRGPDKGFNQEVFWCHSITTGIASRIIAQALRLTHVERFFIAGLLHDIGKMVLWLLLPNESLKIQKSLENPSVDSTTVEQKYLGFTHAELGAELMRSWHFPESIIDAAALHHLPSKAGKYHQEVAIVHIANSIANNIQAPISRDDDTLLDQNAVQTLGLTPEMIERFHEEVYAQLDAVLQVLYYEIAA